MTRPTDAANKPSQSYCRVYRKVVSVLTNGYHEVLRHFQGAHDFLRDQRPRLEAPGWCVLDFHGNPLGDDELERQKESKIQKGLLAVRD